RLMGAGSPDGTILLDVRLRSGSPGPAKFVAARLASLSVTDGKTVQDLPWSELHPEMVPELVDRLIAAPEPSDRLAAAIVCLRAGRVQTAHRLLSDLRSGPLKIVAERYLALAR
ncbi:MAG TPA: hypothetical protein VF950_03325, partial [Planctomycetota bacterium]